MLRPFHGSEDDAENDDYEYKRVFGRRGDEFFQCNRLCLQLMEFIENDPKYQTKGNYRAKFTQWRKLNEKGYKLMPSVEAALSSLVEYYGLVPAIREHNRKLALQRMAKKAGLKMKNMKKTEEFEVEEDTPEGKRTYVIEREVYEHK